MATTKSNSTSKQTKKQPSDCCRCNETKSKTNAKTKAKAKSVEKGE